MPKSASGRKREQQRIWQFKDQWIGQEAGSANYYRCWYTGAGPKRRVSRKSLGTSDLEAAKAELVRIILGEAPEDPLAPGEVYFSAVMRVYMDNHGKFIRSKNAAQRSFDLALAYLKKATGEASPKVSDFTLARQEAFMRWCRDEHKLSAKSIATYLAMIRAGMEFAAKPRIITDSKGRERETKTLSAAPFIQTAEKEICRVTALPRPAPREFIPTDAQLAAFLDATYDDEDEQDVAEREHIFRYCIMALNTWARPEAICELNVSTQVDFANGIIDLNPRGRAQNNKYRPTIRLTDNLKGWLLHWNQERPISYRGNPVKEVLAKTFKKVGKRAGVPEMVRYSLRHFMNTRAMGVPADIRPDREERAIWMGHFDPRFRTTLAYEHRNPDHLVKCMKATDSILRMLDRISGKPLFSPNSLPSAGLTVVENQGYMAG